MPSEQAAVVYDRAAFIRFGFAALLNFPTRDYAKETQHLAGASSDTVPACHTWQLHLGMCTGRHLAVLCFIWRSGATS